MARIYSWMTKKSYFDPSYWVNAGLSFSRDVATSVGTVFLFNEWFLNEGSSDPESDVSLLRYLMVSVGATFLLGELLVNENSPFSLKQKNEILKNPDGPLPLYYDRVKTLKKKWDKENEIQKTTADILLDRARSLANIYQKTHYVFIHAYNSSMVSSVDLQTVFLKKDGAPKPHFFKYVRTPQDISPDEIKRRVSRVQINGSTFVNDLDEQTRAVMISADSDFFRDASCESASDFLRKNSSIACSSFLLNKILSDKKDILSTKEKIDIHSCWEEWEKNNNKKISCGSLYVICVPKHVLKNAISPDQIVYSSHPFGKKCDCHPNLSDIDVLENIQKNQPTRHCMFNAAERNPQFRVIIPNLQKEKGVLYFNLTPYPKTPRRKLKKQLEEIITASSQQCP